MCVRGVEHGHGIPQPHHREVGAHDEAAHVEGYDVGQDVLYWVGVDADDGERSSPLVVLLVEVFIQPSVVQEPDQRVRVMAFIGYMCHYDCWHALSHCVTEG